ncbi:probable protein phosphatase 2C 5 [Selaginella moellendorffii]|nr:probable protein phosphatase 2C 5 [Selaginella moellendorffii]|eukprot:XP_024539743.1 probable protein phosphatase 2C 5 [Selaginella moellendorffii]
MTADAEAPPRKSTRQGEALIQRADSMSLIHLLSREVRPERVERPVLQYGHAAQSKKGEDFVLVKTDCQRVPGDGSSTFGVFAIFDGHNGAAAAIYSKENLVNDVMGAVPSGLSREEWLALLPRALVAGFVKADKEFQRREQSSGTTATFVVIDGLTVTAASVGDSRCILDSEGAVITLTVDHRLEVNEEERVRVTASGGEVGRLSTAAGAEVGPLRCWPGGLCLSRSIGDMDVGEFIVPVPYVKQIKVPASGGRLIIATDGVWDALNSEQAAKYARGLPPEIAAKQIVKEALRSRGLRDDTTCLVVDIVPPPVRPTAPVAKKQSRILKVLDFRHSFNVSKLTRKPAGTRRQVEEIFEEGSAMLADRLFPAPGGEGVLKCAICQEMLTVSSDDENDGSFFSLSPDESWEGPFLCKTCKLKKDAMEGKLCKQRLQSQTNGA